MKVEYMKKLLWTFLCLCGFVGQSEARTWFLQPDGTGDAPTISAAIDSSVYGDVIELTCGEYFEEGIYLKSGVTIRSESGTPECAVVQGRQPTATPGGIFIAHGVDETTLLEGITITGGWATSHYFGYSGGGIAIFSNSALTVRRCQISGNFAQRGGGVEISSDSHPLFEECMIFDNEAILSAGGVSVILGSFRAVDSMVSGNLSESGPADGLVGINGEAYFNCCEFTPEQWQFDGSLEVDDTNCGQVETEKQSWGSIKSFYR